jgi:hypothetical protein
MVYVDRQDCGLPHVELEPFPSGIDLTTNYAAQVTAAPNGGQFQAIQQQIAREYAIAFSQSEYDWTMAAPVQIFFVLVAVLAVPCFIWRMLMRLGWLEERTLWAGASSPASGQDEKLFPPGQSAFCGSPSNTALCNFEEPAAPGASNLYGNLLHNGGRDRAPP